MESSNRSGKWKAGTFFHHIVQAAKERGESVSATIEWAVGLGYSAAELDADDLSGTEFLAEKGMKVSSIYRNYRWHETIDRELMEDHIRIAKRLNAPMIMAIPGFYSDAGHNKNELKKMHEGMEMLSVMARENELILTIEDYDNALSPIATMSGIGTFLEAVPDLKFTLDTGNFIFSEEDVLVAEDLFLSGIRHVHLKDRLWSRAGSGDILETTEGRKMYPCAVGEGDIPIDDVLGRLAKTDYAGYVMTEFFGSVSYAENIEKSIINLRRKGWVE